MIIEVTQEMIDSGEPKSPCRCAIALAIQPKLNPIAAKCIAVRRDHVAIGHHYRYPLPEIAQDSIRAFDGGHDCEPFSFPLPLEELVGGGE